MSLSDQGIKIRIRKDVRSRKRNQDDLARENAEGGGGGDDEYEDDDGDYGRDDGAAIHPHAAESSRMAITSGNDSGAAGGPTKGRAARRKASTGARFAADIVPSGKGGSSRPTKRQRTQGGTVIDLSQNNVPLPLSVAVAASMSPPKRHLGGPEGDSSGHDAPSSTGPKNWAHLPEPTIKGGVPLDVEEHPATKLDPRLKHTLPSGSTTPPNGSKATKEAASGPSEAASTSSATAAAPSGRTVQRHARSASMNQAGAPPLQLQVSSGPNPHRTISHHHHHSSSHGGTPSDAYPSSSWAAPQFSPVQPQGMQHGQQLQSGPLHGQQSNLAGAQHQGTTGYHLSAQRTSAPGMGAVGPSGMGMGMALPPLQIPQQQQQGSRQVSMSMHTMTPIQPHAYAQGYSGASGDLTASPEMMHPSMNMGPPPPPHGHGPAGYGEPTVRQGMMLPASHQQPYMSPEGAPGAVYGVHGHGPMQMQSHMQQYPAHHHTYSHPHSQQQQQSHSMTQQPPRPSPTTYVHHTHHLSDPHIHAHTHTYETYGAPSTGGAGGASEASPGMIAMGLSPISPARGTPLSAHPPQQQQQDMYPGSASRDPYGPSGYPPRHAPPPQQQQQLPPYGEQRHASHVQGGPPYGEVGPPMYAHGHAPSNGGYSHPHGERGWGPEED